MSLIVWGCWLGRLVRGERGEKGVAGWCLCCDVLFTGWAFFQRCVADPVSTEGWLGWDELSKRSAETKVGMEFGGSCRVVGFELS